MRKVSIIALVIGLVGVLSVVGTAHMDHGITLKWLKIESDGDLALNIGWLEHEYRELTERDIACMKRTLFAWNVLGEKEFMKWTRTDEGVNIKTNPLLVDKLKGLLSIELVKFGIRYTDERGFNRLIVCGTERLRRRGYDCYRSPTFDAVDMHTWLHEAADNRRLVLGTGVFALLTDVEIPETHFHCGKLIPMVNPWFEGTGRKKGKGIDSRDDGLFAVAISSEEVDDWE